MSIFNEAEQKIEESRAFLGRIAKMIDIPKLKKDIVARETEAGEPSFWADSSKAKKKSKELNELKKLLEQWQTMEGSLDDLKAHLDLAAEAGDAGELKEIEKGVKAAEDLLLDMDARLKLSGEFDHNDAIISLHAGAGGTEACDWNDMLLRMYTRWAQGRGFQFIITDILKGEEAGVKSVSAFVRGPYAHGYLKSENGVHRLVRISPFDSNKRRHTSFASCDVLPDIEEEIDIQVADSEVELGTFRAG